MTPFFRWVESTPLSVWTRESTSIFAFPAILSAHAIGMALAAGVSAIVALRLLGAVRGIPPTPLRAVVPIFWFGFWLNAASGLLLLVAYPTKALTNPVFYVKLLSIAVGVAISTGLSRRLGLQPFDEGLVSRRGRTLAAVTLLAWTSAIFAGRLLAYTHHRVLADF